MPAPVVPAPVPTVIPAVAERVYDRYHTEKILIHAPDPNGTVAAVITLRKGLVNGSGLWELSMGDEPVNLAVPDVFAEAAADADLAQAVGAILLYVAKLAAARLTPAAPPPPPPPAPPEPEE